MQLIFFRQAGAQAVEVEFAGVQPFGLNDDLMPLFFRKTNDFVFYGGTIPGTYTLDCSIIERRSHQSIANGLMHTGMGFHGPAKRLVGQGAWIGGIAERLDFCVPWKFRETAEVQAVAVHAG